MPQMLSINEISKMTGISYNAIRCWCISGQFKGFVKAGSKYLINVERFKEFLNGETQDAAGMDKTS